MTKSQFTAQDAKDLEIPLELLQEWERIMNMLWDWLKFAKQANPKIIVTNADNFITYKDQWHKLIIGVFFYNNKYLKLSIKIDGNNVFEAEVSHINKFSDEGILKIAGHIIAYAQHIKP